METRLQYNLTEASDPRALTFSFSQFRKQVRRKGGSTTGNLLWFNLGVGLAGPFHESDGGCHGIFGLFGSQHQGGDLLTASDRLKLPLSPIFIRGGEATPHAG